jgi:hypothetical protein
VVTVSVNGYIPTLPTTCADMLTTKRIGYTVGFMQQQKLLTKKLSYDDVVDPGFCTGVDKLVASQ